MAYTVTDALRLTPGPVSLADHDPADTSLFEGGKRKAQKALRDTGAELADLQERMYADAYTGGRRRVLIVLQGMDTSGKGGVIDHALGLLSPNGFRLQSFKKPTEEELEHDFLWRVEQALPDAGMVGVFDRSHYEDVLIARVDELVDEEEIERRYQAINDFEKSLVDSGTVVIKCMLNVSAERAEGAAAGASRRPGQAVEVQAGGRRRARALGRLPGGLRDRSRALPHRRGAVVRRAERPQVVPQLGRRPAAARGVPRDAAGVAEARLRRRGAACAARGRG